MTDYLIILLAYLLGSISTAIIVCRIAGYPDPRTEGSSNPGATNVLRIGGKKAAAVVLLLDMFKGVLAVSVAHWFEVSAPILALTGLAVFLGHLYPVFFGFDGGKGVATGLGVQYAIAWQLGLFVTLIWLFIAKVLKMSSLAALVAMTLAPVFVWWLGLPREILWMQLVITALLVWRHRSNIQRMVNGTEDAINNANKSV